MTKRVSKGSDGKYHIKGRKYELLIGSRAQVHHGTAYKTPGGLTKDKLLMNKNGRLVSRKKHKTAKNDNRLKKAGWGTIPGQFGAVRLDSKKSSTRKSKRGSRRKSRRR